MIKFLDYFQAVPILVEGSSQTELKHPKNVYTQYEPRVFTDDEVATIWESDEMKKFMIKVNFFQSLSMQLHIWTKCLELSLKNCCWCSNTVKAGLISERFSLWLHLPKNYQIPILSIFSLDGWICIAQDCDLARILGDGIEVEYFLRLSHL